MRYLALLYDSLREALDSKVLYVTLVLSFVLIALVGSLNFRPVTVKDEAERIASTLTFAFSFEAMGPVRKTPATCSVLHAKQTNNATEPWNGDYDIAMSLKLPPGMPGTPAGQEKTILFVGMTEMQFWYLKNKVVDQQISPDGQEIKLLITSRGTKIGDREHWPHEPGLLFGVFPMPFWTASLAYWVYSIQNLLVNTVGGWTIILISILVTAGFVPSMLQRGAVELLLVKPASRVTLLIFKYLGGLTFVFVNSLIAIGGVWLMLGLRTGIWTWSFPLSVLVLTAFFAIIYSVSTLFGVLTRNAIVAIFMTCLIWGLLFLIGTAYASYHREPSTNELARFEQPRQSPFGEAGDDTIKDVITTLHFVLPRTNDLGHLTTQLISQELLTKEERQLRDFQEQPPFTWTESLLVSAAFITLMLGIACWRFAVFDY